MIRRALVCCALAAAVVSLSATASGPRSTAAVAQAGTASISGVVVTTDEPPQVIRRAIVTLTGGGAGDRYAISDDNGRFSFQGLRAGRYMLSASKKSFVTIGLGALRAGQPGAPIILGDAQRLDDVRIRLARGAVITGTVRDESGEPVPGLNVRVEATTTVGNSRPLTFTTATDDQGTYRVFGLPSGSYLVSTRPTGTPTSDLTAPTDAEVDAALRELQARRAAGPPTPAPGVRNIPPTTPARAIDFVPVFHPAVFTREEATAITLAAGEERGGADITVRPLSTSAVAGQVVNMGTRPPHEIEITLNRAGQTGPAVGAFRTVARADGSFRIGGVTPGRYLLAARALTAALMDASFGKPAAAAPAGACAVAAAEVHAAGANVDGVSLTLRPCLRIEGRVVANGAPAAAGALAGAVVTLQSVANSPVPMYMPLRVPAAIGTDGRFLLGQFGDVLPGAYQVSITLPGGASDPRGWRVESAIVDGRDVIDLPLEIATDRTSSIAMTVNVSDRPANAIAGTLETAPGRLATEYTVIAFPVNQDWWRAPHRRVKAARPSHTGEYVIHDLPAGEYFLAALSDLAPDEWRDRAFLELAAPAALRFTLGAGEQKTQDIRIAR